METASLKALYRDTVLDHSRHPRNFGRLEHADRQAEGHNPLCGDKVTLYLQLSGECLTEARFEASGCALATASASLLTEAVKGQSTGASRELAEAALAAFRPDGAELPAPLAPFQTVRDYPSRIRCVTLAWQTLLAALNRRSEVVTTEPMETPHVRTR